MATIRRFQDIEAWQSARELTLLVYAFTKRPGFAEDFGLKNQVRRAAVSVMSNIAEGFERSGHAEFIQFLSVAKGSTGELESQMQVALDQDYIGEPEFDEFTAVCLRTRRQIAGFMHYLRTGKRYGIKFKTD